MLFTGNPLEHPQVFIALLISQNPGTTNMFAPFMSGVDRTPGGNTVFAFGHNKRIIEVTPEGEVVANFRVPGPGNLFRVRRYGFDYPGLDKLK